MTVNRAAKRGWILSFLGNVAGRLIGLATGILAARLLLPEGRGALAATLLWPQILAALGLLSVPAALTLRISEPKTEARTLPASGLSLALILAVLTSVAGIPLVRGLLFGTDPELVSLATRFLIAFVPFNFIVLTLAAVDQGRMRFGRFNLLRLLPQIVYLLTLAGLGLSQRVSVTTVVWAVWLATAVTCGVRVLVADKDTWARPNADEARGLLKTGLGFHLTTVITILAAQIDKIFVVRFWQNQDIGYYTVALTFAVAGVSVITGAFDTVLFPRLATARTREDQQATLGRAVRVGMLLLTLTVLALAVLSRWLVPALFGKAFLASVPVGIVLLAAQIPGALRQIVVGGLRGLGEWRARAAAEAVALLAFSLLALPLSSPLGLEGIAVALLAANLLAFSTCLVYLRRAHGFAFRDWWGLDRRTLSELRQEIAGLVRALARR